ncbi:MAG TPA: fructose-bisphosphatase class III [Phycisphaerales bacterium]|nr:fructose-bisphosphatase class III [Phycisphaerales bacterium]
MLTTRPPSKVTASSAEPADGAAPESPAAFDAVRLAHLQALAMKYPTPGPAISEAAALRATLDLPAPTVHVISDIHGEDAKLRHVINNASGALRLLVDQILGERLHGAEKDRFLAVLYYPREAINLYSREIVASGRRTEWVYQTLSMQFEIIRHLRARVRRAAFEKLLQPEYRELFVELGSGQRPDYIRAMIEGLARFDRDWGAVRAAARLVRNLSCDELLVIGDLGDRGPRADRVIETLMRQPKCNVLWGNHDMLWLGAHLGHEPCMLTLLRFSLRYRRLSQLEEGYGIIMAPIERLARDVYGDDPAERFMPKGEGFRDTTTVARMQKAITIMQFKAEGRAIQRHPEWNLEHRRLLHRIKFQNGRAVSVEIDGKQHPMLDGRLPTLLPEATGGDPYAYTPEEQACIDRMDESFIRSHKLREHMDWLVRRGGMWTTRDDVLLFHACVPVDAGGKPLALKVDGQERSGRDLMDALGSVLRRAHRKRWFGLDEDADWIWYMWGGPLSPLFGKDKLATFETSFIADKEAQKEHKNPYFELLHDRAFVDRIGAMFGVHSGVLVVNGHVPVKVEKGEQPVKRGGNAITIDGAFSEAYGDRGYTLVLRPDRIDLAEHSPFEGVEAAVLHGADILPKVTTIRTYPHARTLGETDRGASVRQSIGDLEALVRGYQEGLVRPEH